MRFLLTALLVFGIFAGISSAFHGPRWGGYYGYGYRGGAPCGWYYPPPQYAPGQPYAPQPPAAPSTPNAPPPAAPQ